MRFAKIKINTLRAIPSHQERRLPGKNINLQQRKHVRHVAISIEFQAERLALAKAEKQHDLYMTERDDKQSVLLEMCFTLKCRK